MHATIKPHHFLDYMYEMAAFNGQFNPVMDSGASYGYYGTLIAAGKIDTVTFTTGADDPKKVQKFGGRYLPGSVHHPGSHCL